MDKFAKQVSRQIERKHAVAHQRILTSFHKLRMHPLSYKETAKPPRKRPRQLPSKVPAGFNTKAAGIFSFLVGKANLIKKASKLTAKQVIDHIKKNPAAVAKDVAKIGSAFLMKKASNRANAAIRQVVRRKQQSHSTAMKKHADQAVQKVREFLKKNKP